MERKCPYCWTIFITKPPANNVKYCSKKCRVKDSYQKHKEEHTRRNREVYNKYAPWKIQCAICFWWYKKVCSHVYYRHHMDERAYKTYLWRDVSKWIVTEELHEHLRECALDNDMDKQHKEAWKNTRFSKKKPPKKYTRSQETLERLKTQWHTTPAYKLHLKKQ